jgi:hypothetical protein
MLKYFHLKVNKGFQRDFILPLEMESFAKVQEARCLTLFHKNGR